MLRAVLVFAFLAAMAMALEASGAPERRVALVVGNGGYPGEGALANPANDAKAVAGALRALGFETALAVDTDEEQLVDAISRFSEAARGARIALMFYAGHGIQIEGRNYMLPIDVSAQSAWALRHSSVAMQEVVAEMEARAEVALVLVDACRNNPYSNALYSGTRAVSAPRGLGVMDLSGKGAIIAYAAAAGAVAADGDGEHSPYTEALLQEIDSRGVEVGLMLRRVAKRVVEKTHGTQKPELLVRLIDEVYLNEAPEIPTEVASNAPAAGGDSVLGTAIRSILPESGATQSAASEPPPDPSSAPSVAPVRKKRGFWGERLILRPAWLEGYREPKATGWHAAPATRIVDTAPGKGFSGAKRLPLAARLETRIVERGQTPWYTVEVPTAGNLSLRAAAPPPEIDLAARVWNQNHEVVANWQGATKVGAPFEGVYPVSAPGRYYIEISDGRSDAASPAPFLLDVDFVPADDPFEPNPSRAQARPVRVDADIRPTVFPRGDFDWLTFFVERPGLLTVKATEVPETLDIVYRVWNFNNQVVANWAQPARLGGDTLMEAAIAEPGQYFLEIHDGRDDAASTQSYRLSMAFKPVEDRFEPNNNFGTAAHVKPDGAHRIAIFPRGESDWLSFDIDHPGEMSFSARKVPKNLDVVMRVWTADKAAPWGWAQPLRVGGDTEGHADLPKPGRYTLEIRDGRDDAQSSDLFDLELGFSPQPDQYEPNNNFAEARPLKLNHEILFNILPRGDHDWYRIRVPSAGELSANVDPTPENLDIVFRFWDSDYRAITGWAAPYRQGGATVGFADLPAAGTYFIEIADGRDDARSIEPAVLKAVFRPTADAMEPNNSIGAAAPLELGKPHRAHILPRGDSDWYSFTADRAGSLDVAIVDVPENLDLHFRLWNEDGRAFAWNAPMRVGGPNEATVPIAAPGRYVLEVRDGRDDARSTAPYTITAHLR